MKYNTNKLLFIFSLVLIMVYLIYLLQIPEHFMETTSVNSSENDWNDDTNSDICKPDCSGFQTEFDFSKLCSCSKCCEEIGKNTELCSQFNLIHNAYECIN
jgi:hypothetical protein